MAGPINGLGAQQVAQQLTSASQSREGGAQIRDRDEDRNASAIERGEAIRGSDIGTVESQETEAQNQQNNFAQQLDQVASPVVTAEAERGSLIDITV